MHAKHLLVERLGVGGGGGDVSVTGSLVGTGGLLQSLGIGKVGGAGGVVGRGIAGDEVEVKKREHLRFACERTIFVMRNVHLISARGRIARPLASPPPPSALGAKRRLTQARVVISVRGHGGGRIVFVEQGVLIDSEQAGGGELD